MATSDIDVAVVIPKVAGKTALRVSEEYHNKFTGNKQKPQWNNRTVDYQFFYADDPELSELTRLPLATTETQMAAKPEAEELTPKEIHEQTLEELAETLDKRETKIETPIEKLNRGGVYKVIHSMKSLGSNLYQNFMRVERMLEGLDGHKEGAFYEKIWRPLKEADEFE